MTQELWVPHRLPGMNEIISASKGFKGRGIGYSTMKRQWTAVVAGYARKAKLAPMPYAALSFVWHEPKANRDPDNLTAGAKFVLDGLKDAGVLPGDGWLHVTALSHLWLRSSTPGVLVTLTRG